jgi:AIPR protein
MIPYRLSGVVSMPKQDVDAFNLYYPTWCQDRLVGLPNVKPFEFFCADQFLKHRSLTDTETLLGQVDGTHDGGVDSFYSFFGGLPIDDTTVIDSRSNGDFELVLIQSKQPKGFSPIAVQKFGLLLDDLLGRDEADYVQEYHEKIARLMRIFKTKFREHQKRSHPKLSIELLYISGLDVQPKPDSLRAAKAVEIKAAKYYNKTEVKPVRFVNVGGLWTQSQIAPPSKKHITLQKAFSTKEGWVGLATLPDFYEFLKGKEIGADGKPEIDDQIFDANVRGYQMNAPVNKRITATLTGANKPEFWLLNNGITILSPKALLHSERLAIDNPQIVNGLQTSRRIFEYFKSLTDIQKSDERRIIIRVIETNDELTRSEIIRATNDQNQMPAEALISTWRIQHQIEPYFEANGLFYDRRKGHHKAEKKPVDKIVSILLLVQAIIAIVLRKPDDARARPRDYLKEKKRELIFGSEDSDSGVHIPPHDLGLYLRCVQIVRKVDSYLASLSLDNNTILNLRFYIALDMTAQVTASAYCPIGSILVINVERDFTDKLMKESYQRIHRLYKAHGGNDEAAKGKAMIGKLTSDLIMRHSPPRKRKTTKRKK